MNIDEVNGFMDLAEEELSTAKILFDAKKYRGSVTHSYYAMFDAAKALLLSHDFVSKKHDTILTQFSKDFVRDDDFSQDIYQYYAEAKKLRRKSSYDFTVNFSKEEALNCLVHAEEFIAEAKRFL
jgi:uncharacterized protein (UPF0332 family)